MSESAARGFQELGWRHRAQAGRLLLAHHSSGDAGFGQRPPGGHDRADGGGIRPYDRDYRRRQLDVLPRARRSAAALLSEASHRRMSVSRRYMSRNDSDETLECKGEIAYAGTDSKGQAATTSKLLVGARGTFVLTESLAKQGTNADTFDAQCTRASAAAAAQHRGELQVRSRETDLDRGLLSGGFAGRGRRGAGGRGIHAVRQGGASDGSPRRLQQHVSAPGRSSASKRSATW